MSDATAPQIPWFNPREMDDATLLALSTGRDALVAEFLAAVQRRLDEPAPGGHWLVTGTRGAGKSYFLRLAQTAVRQRMPADKVRFVLLPEELRNVRAPHDLLDEIRRMLDPSVSGVGRPSMWRTPEPAAAWGESLKTLFASFDEGLLVIGVENFAQLMRKAFADDAAASLLRKLMAHEARVMLLATAVDGSFDEDYSQRLFRQFEHHLLPPWDEHAHRRYLSLRAALLHRRPTLRQLSRIDAYSRYTGGNARVAAILAAAILDEQDFLKAGTDLNATLDKMSDYYREVVDRMPDNTAVLFDALVRGGEPCSQTLLAERVGARQNEISRAFLWLMDSGYLAVEGGRGRKDTRYRVADRLFVQWYRMRYLEPGQRGRLAVLAELLADTVEFGDKWRFARQLADEGHEEDALLMAGLGFDERGISLSKLQASGATVEDLLRWGEGMRAHEALRTKIPFGDAFLPHMLNLLERFPGNEEMRAELDDAIAVTRANQRFAAGGDELVDLCLSSLSFSPAEILFALREFNLPGFQEQQWNRAIQTFKNERDTWANHDDHEGLELLKKLRQDQRSHPFAGSWHEISDVERYRLFPAHFSALTTNAISASASAVALRSWLQLPDHFDRAEEAAARFIKAEQSLIKHGLFDMTVTLSAILLEHWPTNGPARFRAQVLANNAQGLIGLEKDYPKAVALAQDAVEIFSTTGTERDLAFALRQLGWAQGAMQNWQEALLAHERSLEIEQGDNRAWDTGQAARYTVHIKGTEAAWQLIDTLTDPSMLLSGITQLGDAVWDRQRADGLPEAYALARELLTGLAGRSAIPLEAGVRALFIDMLDIGVDLALLSDLARDLPRILPVEESGALGEVLGAWFRFLADRKTTIADPDWTTTLAALNDSIGIEARIRLGLTEPPQLDPEGAAMVERILAFIRR